MTVGQVVAKLGVDPREYEKGLRQAERQADKAGSKIGSIFGNAFSVTLGMAMFDVLRKVFKATISIAIDFNSMLQTAQIGFTTMLGSAERAQKFLDDMADFAARTPFEYPELLEASKRMLAYGFAAEEVLPTLRAVGDASAALGSGSVGIDRITLALGQIRAKGKLSAEEMRQLTEAGVPAWHILADAMGTTVPELQKMVSKGLIPGYKAVEMLTAGMTKRFGGMMASMENTWQGVTSSIKDIWRMTVGTLTSTLFEGLNKILIKVRDFLHDFYKMLNAVMGKKAKQTTDSLTQGTENHTEAMTDLSDATEEAVKAQRKLAGFDVFHDITKTQTSDAAAGVAAGLVDTTPISGTPELEEETEVPGWLNKLLEPLKSINFSNLINSLKELKDSVQPFTRILFDGLWWAYTEIFAPLSKFTIEGVLPRYLDTLAISANGLSFALQKLGKVWKIFSDYFLKPVAQYLGPKFLAFWDKAKKKISDLTNLIKKSKAFNDLEDILKKILPPLSDLTKAFGDLFLLFSDFVMSAIFTEIKYFWKDLEDLIGLVAAVIKGDFSDAWGHLKNLFLDNKIDYIKEKFGNLKTAIGEVADKVKEWIGVWKENINNFIDTWNAKISNWWDNNVKPWFTVEKWNEILFNIGVSLGNAVNKFVEIWTKDIPNWWENDVKPWFTIEKWKELFSSIVKGLKNKIDDFVSTWKTIIKNWWENDVKPWFTFEKWKELGSNIKDGIVYGFKSAVKGIADILNWIIGSFEDLINIVIRGINKIIEGFNSVSVFKIKPLAEFSAPKIPVPEFAKGGIVHGEIPAIVGDNFNARLDPEVISPLSKLKDLLVEALIQKDILTGSSNEIRITLQLENGEVLADMLIDPLNNKAKNLGYAPVFKPAGA